MTSQALHDLLAPIPEPQRESARKRVKCVDGGIEMSCPDCNGSGKVALFTSVSLCRRCHGTVGDKLGFADSGVSPVTVVDPQSAATVKDFAKSVSDMAEIAQTNPYLDFFKAVEELLKSFPALH